MNQGRGIYTTFDSSYFLSLLKETVEFTSADADVDGNYTLTHTRGTKDLIFQIKDNKDKTIECQYEALSTTQLKLYLYDTAISGTWKLMLV